MQVLPQTTRETTTAHLSGHSAADTPSPPLPPPTANMGVEEAHAPLIRIDAPPVSLEQSSPAVGESGPERVGANASNLSDRVLPSVAPAAAADERADSESDAESSNEDSPQPQPQPSDSTARYSYTVRSGRVADGQDHSC